MAFSDLVLKIQTDLSRLAFFPGRLDGLMGDRTQSALDQARQRYGLHASSLPEASEMLAGVVLIERMGALMLNVDEFAAMFPYAPADYLDHLNESLLEGSLNRDWAEMFLAQLGHESAGLRYFEEIASGQAYEGRRDLGNTEPGDGRRYKGRGPIQLTGRANYRRFGMLLGLDLEGDPEMAAHADVGFRVAVMYWTDRNLNGEADRGGEAAFKRVTRAINGGYNGYDDRVRWLTKIRKILEDGPNG